MAAQSLPRDALARLRARRPVVHNITNDVVANFTANALLALGASPVMAPAPEEAAEMVAIAQALVINIGTLTLPQIAGMRAAVRAANAAGKPWVLDPVACGASRLRLDAALELLSARPAVVRGNASEIMALAGAAGARTAIDSAEESSAARAAAQALAQSSGAVIAVTGAIDYVVDAGHTVALANGHRMLTRITGTGCTATALVGAFLGAGFEPAQASICALVTLGVAGEIAAESSSGPGSFQVALLDALAALDDAALAERFAPG